MKTTQQQIAAAMAETTKSAIIYISEEMGDDIVDRVYIFDGDKYIATYVMDDTWNHDNDAGYQVECNSLLFATDEGIFYRNSEEEYFSLLEAATETTAFRVLDANNYWRDVKRGPQLLQRGAYRGSQLVSKNPVTGKFGDAPADTTRSYGQHFCVSERYNDECVEGTLLVYKRDTSTGVWQEDAEFPALTCMSAGNDEVEISLSYYTKAATYSYKSSVGGKSMVFRGDRRNRQEAPEYLR